MLYGSNLHFGSALSLRPTAPVHMPVPSCTDASLSHYDESKNLINVSKRVPAR